MPSRNCTVSFIDHEGFRHSVDVQAETLYEAVVLAVRAFREHGCAPGSANQLEVEAKSPGVTHTVTIAKSAGMAGRVLQEPQGEADQGAAQGAARVMLSPSRALLLTRNRAATGRCPIYDGFMTLPFLDECLSVLTRTPATLDSLLRDLPEAWTAATEGPGTWSPYVVIGHLIHCEKTDWMPRLAIILEHGPSRPFDPFDREAQLREDQSKPLSALLDEFSALRRDSLERLRTLDLQQDQLELKGTHPELGPVTARQLLATWTAHDLGHILQVSRVMAKRYKHEVGPWAEYLSVMK